jgi:polysaccharide biosynthesis protein PslG
MTPIILRYSIRLGLLLLVLSFIAPVTHRVLLPPPQSVETLQPHVCVHTDLIHEVEAWAIQRTLATVREMGAETIVEFFPWGYIEGPPGQYDWRQTDRIVRHAENQGIRIIARMGLVPTWARPDDSPMNLLSSDQDDAFADFVAVFAARYAGRINHLIIWNEPNLAFEWGFDDYSPARYADLLATVYPRVKAANPETVILAGALAPTLEPVASPNGTDDLIYLRDLYDLGADAHFDALAVHTYGFDQPATADPHPRTLNFRRVELLRQIMREYDDDKPVYITESGWNDDSRWSYAVSPARRIAYTLDAYQYSAEHWPYVEELCLWIFRHPYPRGNYRDDYTLVTPEFQLKPIYSAVQAYARGWQDDSPLWLPPPEID